MTQFILNLAPLLALGGSVAILVGFARLSRYLVQSFSHSQAYRHDRIEHRALEKLESIHAAGEEAIHSVRLIGGGLIAQVAGFSLMAIEALSSAAL